MLNRAKIAKIAQKNSICRWALKDGGQRISHTLTIRYEESQINNNNNNNNNNNFEEGAIKLKTGYLLAPQDHGLVSALKILSKY